MDLIKKKFLLNVTATTATTYNLTVLLSANVKDLGVFDTVEDYNEATYTGHTALFNTPYTVTGNSESRLSELEKYAVSTLPWLKYFLSTTPTTDGLDLTQSNTGGTGGEYEFVYYVGGIEYHDVTPTGSTATTTYFTMSFTGLTHANFDDKPIIKFESKQNMVENPQVSRDVFIVRQQQPVFEKNYRLRAVNSLNETLTYAGGNYFTIINNT